MLSDKVVALAFAFVVALAITKTCLAQDSPADYVAAHITARSAVGVGPVSWDLTVQAYAQSYANKRKGDCQLLVNANSSGIYGENISMDKGMNYTGIDAVIYWVSQVQYYSYSNNTCSTKTCGLYTQVVWRNTTKIGCAKVVCDASAGIFIACYYSPPGNVPGMRPY